MKQYNIKLDIDKIKQICKKVFLIYFFVIFTFDKPSINWNESTGMDRFLSDKYSNIHFSNNGLLFCTGDTACLVSVAGSLTMLEISSVVATGLWSSGFVAASMSIKPSRKTIRQSNKTKLVGPSGEFWSMLPEHYITLIHQKSYTFIDFR